MRNIKQLMLFFLEDYWLLLSKFCRSPYLWLAIFFIFVTSPRQMEIRFLFMIFVICILPLLVILQRGFRV